jgi:peroxiredoxin (alkyl hydroperoxide reductase subunit C)
VILKMNGKSQYDELAEPNAIAPLFSAEAYNNVEKSIEEIQLEALRGKWVVLFFYPSNFTFV